MNCRTFSQNSRTRRKSHHLWKYTCFRSLNFSSVTGQRCEFVGRVTFNPFPAKEILLPVEWSTKNILGVRVNYLDIYSF